MYVMVTETDMFETLHLAMSRNVRCIMLPNRHDLTTSEFWVPFQGAKSYNRAQSKDVLGLLVANGFAQKETVHESISYDVYRLSTPYEIVQHKMSRGRTK